MSNRHRHHESSDGAGASHGGHAAPGKRSRTASLPARPKADAPARDDDDDAIGPGDLEALPPVIARIIDLAARDSGTQLIVSKGRSQGVHLYGKAVVVTPEGRKIADAEIKQVNGGTTVLITRASMDVIDTNEGVVRFEDDSFGG
ncbi:MAG TPA: hypothetical protein VM261_16830, partial [Kofleriaceae bacterium]|nr:hypothetical protein [Kofleriaceae bacterium]